MEKERLIERLRYVMGKKDVLALADFFARTEGGVSLLFELSNSTNEKLSFHAAWVLEHVMTSDSTLFALGLPEIIEKLPSLKNPSVRRHYCKLLKLSIDACQKNILPKDACNLLRKIDMEPIVEVCFEWLMDSNVKPAVKVHCMDILLYLSNRYHWIIDELPHVIEHQIIDGSPGLINKGQKIQSAIRRNRYL